METDKNNLLPPEFHELVANNTVIFCWENVAKTFLIKSENGYNRYLKIQPVGKLESLETQSKRLSWCSSKIQVPKVIDYGVLGDYEYLITLELAGLDATNNIFKNNTKELIILLAHGLQTIHEVSIVDCPFDHSINQLLKLIRNNYEQGLIDTNNLSLTFGEANIEKLINEVEAYSKNLNEDLVFTHGDYSLPNIIINDGRINGFIDLGSCGVADRYYDLAVAEYSILRNCGKEYLDLFYSSYGISNVDQQRLRFYKIIEQLVWV